MQNVKNIYIDLLNNQSLFKQSFTEVVNKKYKIGEELEKLDVGIHLNLDVKVIGVSFSIYTWDTEKDIIGKCNVCESNFDSNMSDKDMLKLMREKKAKIEKRVEICLFLCDLLNMIKGEK